MITSDVKNYILEELHRIEHDFNVKVLYACESGSRAWGFSNIESDYDIRFIYLRPVDYYLTLTPVRDVIDYNDLKDYNYTEDLDFSGWDIKKALYQHYKSNPSLREWIKSPIIYYGTNSYFNDLPSFNPIALKYHYASMTKDNWDKYVKGKHTDDFSPRVVKTYCYCIRQILSWILIDENGSTDIPVNTYEIINQLKDYDTYINPKLYDTMKLLLEYYKSNLTLNKFNEDTILLLSEWIQTHLNFMKTAEIKKKEKLPKKDMNQYNSRFQQIIKTINFQGW